MLTEVKNQLKVSFLSVRYALQREMLNKVTFISNVFFMILNDASFIIQWIIFYSLKDSVGGYTFSKVLLLWGLAAATFGFSRFFFKDAFKLSDTINSGKLDVYLIQPKNLLISSITSSVEVSSIGDIIYGYIMLIFYGLSLRSFLLFTLFSFTGALIITSVSIIFSSLTFWFGRVEVAVETINSQMINFATYPDGIFKGLIKLLFYTFLPLAFSNYIPVQIISEFNIFYFLIVILITSLFVATAFLVFYKGLEKYSSSNLMNARV